jgi:uncharacterized protein (DUF58 family)
VRFEYPALSLAVLIGLLTILGISTDAASLIIAASLLLLYLGIRAVVFLSRAAEVVTSVTIDRVAEHLILRQGAITPVEANIGYQVPQGVSILFRDLAPAGTRILRGNPEATSDPSQEKVSLTYDLQVLSRGDLAFQGIVVEVKDRFYADTLILGKTMFQTPLFHVQPASVYADEVSRVEFGGREVAKFRAIPGQGIRSFRTYHAGDDIRAIDWKLSAKHGKLILREYMGRSGSTPIFILDLPAEVDSNTAVSYEHMIAGLTTRIEQALREFSRTEILVLSGGRVVRTLFLQKDPKPWYRLLSTLLPGEGHLPLFRHPFPFVLTTFHRAIERSSPREGDQRPFFLRLESLTTAFHDIATPIVFERQIGAAFAGKGEREVFIFTLLQGDLSHLEEVIHRAREKRMPVHLRLPARAGTGPTMRKFLQSGAATVEVIS